MSNAVHNTNAAETLNDDLNFVVIDRRQVRVISNNAMTEDGINAALFQKEGTNFNLRGAWAVSGKESYITHKVSDETISKLNAYMNNKTDFETECASIKGLADARIRAREILDNARKAYDKRKNPNHNFGFLNLD